MPTPLQQGRRTDEVQRISPSHLSKKNTEDRAERGGAEKRASERRAKLSGGGEEGGNENLSAFSFSQRDSLAAASSSGAAKEESKRGAREKEEKPYSPDGRGDKRMECRDGDSRNRSDRRRSRNEIGAEAEEAGRSNKTSFSEEALPDLLLASPSTSPSPSSRTTAQQRREDSKKQQTGGQVSAAANEAAATRATNSLAPEATPEIVLPSQANVSALDEDRSRNSSETSSSPFNIQRSLSTPDFMKRFAGSDDWPRVDDDDEDGDSSSGEDDGTMSRVDEEAAAAMLLPHERSMHRQNQGGNGAMLRRRILSGGPQSLLLFPRKSCLSECEPGEK